MIITKPCNLFSDIIEVDETESTVSNFKQRVKKYLNSYTSKKGLWINGRFTITKKELLFSTHSVSDMVRKTDADIILDINKIRRVWNEFGLFSGRINFELEDRVIKIKCNDSKNLAELINSEILKKRA